MTQNQLVLKVLQESGSISRLIGLNYKVKNLPENIRQLRKQGHNIVTVTKLDASGHPYASWVLINHKLRVGSHIRIKEGTDTYGKGGCYTIGDEAEVKTVDADGDLRALFSDGNVYYVHASEYEVIA